VLVLIMRNRSEAESRDYWKTSSSSPRRPVRRAFAIGIARGVAKHFNEPLEVIQTKCMHNGAPL
jgi:hypothetical protein